jgi:hypothetical protein
MIDQTILLIDFVIMLMALIVLFRGLHFAMLLRAKTKKVTPLWLYIEVGMLFLMIYALASIIRFGAYIFLADTQAAVWVSETLDMLKMVLSTAAACFLTAAGLLLKNSPMKPI